jgi:major membrane immunogen (membrane-anchored lipoprotein)
MKNFTILFLLLMSSLLFSCSLLEESNEYVTQYQGNWKGSYQGEQDNGIWEMIVHPNGEITGKITSYVLEAQYEVKGEVNKEGNLNVAAGSVNSGSEFKGIMLEDEASGTWFSSENGIGGEWSGTKP